MICPSCKTGVRFEVTGSSEVFDDLDDFGGGHRGYDVAYGFCPECSQFIVLLRHGKYYQADLNEPKTRELTPVTSRVIHPQDTGRPVGPEVPEAYRRTFGEASATLPVSPKASAALSRRLLQQILREEVHIQGGNLASEIDEFIGRSGVPTHLVDAVDAIRNVGNLAAHPIKNQHTGEVVDVEPGEAEWLLDVLESMFDFVFVQPKRLAERRAALTQKLQAAGKPPLKP
jgi:hypothetical protein